MRHYEVNRAELLTILPRATDENRQATDSLSHLEVYKYGASKAKKKKSASKRKVGGARQMPGMAPGMGIPPTGIPTGIPGMGGMGASGAGMGAAGMGMYAGSGAGSMAPPLSSGPPSWGNSANTEGGENQEINSTTVGGGLSGGPSGGVAAGEHHEHETDDTPFDPFQQALAAHQAARAGSATGSVHMPQPTTSTASTWGGPAHTSTWHSSSAATE